VSTMDAQAIEPRLRAGEDSHTEFKSACEELKESAVAKEIVAFANSRGGQLFLGVEDDGTLTGVGAPKDADQLMRKVVAACQTSVHPAIGCDVSKVEVRGVLILVVDVPAFSPDRPYRADQIHYIRDASTSRVATRDELIRLLQSQDVHFDEAPVSGASRDDLDPDAVESFLRDAYHAGAAAQPAHYLRALKCIEADGTPTVAGMLLFGRAPERFFRDARISAVRFATDRFSTELADRREISGSLLRQIEAATAFLGLYVPAPSRVEGWERAERGIPEVVLREAVLNAIAHRDYRAASQVRLFVFTDRVEVVNPGMLPNQLTLDSIRLGGISHRRNPVIASLLARARRRENLGMGIPEIVAMMRERDLPEPEFDLSGGHFRVVLRWAKPAPAGGST
jgi:ATP-dependent DNA helicase RecG